MTILSELLYQLYVKTIVLFTYMLIELILVICYLKSTKNPITTTQYLNFIEEKNPTTRLKKLAAEHIDCRVCLSEFEEGDIVRSLNCEHTFHKDCLDKWFLQEQYCATCPLCRNKVLSDDVVSKYCLLQNQVEFDVIDDEFMTLLSSLRGGSIWYRYL
ncbi:putative transcription factor C2H2 family [Medicago truncatula]|uniref:Putative transcription factor C2H2 family n=1 Tax=Medicago truncatula TaxID=3880 RepID=A0A396GVX9_MEDTR|nr:putative transcription factor C2H2 family [Medicago truncatula]